MARILLYLGEKDICASSYSGAKVGGGGRSYALIGEGALYLHFLHVQPHFKSDWSREYVYINIRSSPIQVLCTCSESKVNNNKYVWRKLSYKLLLSIHIDSHVRLNNGQCYICFIYHYNYLGPFKVAH